MKTHLTVLGGVVLANYLAQIPYSLYLYHSPFGTNPWGNLLLLGSFLLFVVPYVQLWRGGRGGYVGMLLFLGVEFGFYLYNFVASILHGFPPFFHLLNPDPLLWVVFLIGYINFLSAGYFMVYFVRNPAIAHAAPGASKQQSTKRDGRRGR